MIYATIRIVSTKVSIVVRWSPPQFIVMYGEVFIEEESPTLLRILKFIDRRAHWITIGEMGLLTLYVHELLSLLKSFDGVACSLVGLCLKRLEGRTVPNYLLPYRGIHPWISIEIHPEHDPQMGGHQLIVTVVVKITADGSYQVRLLPEMDPCCEEFNSPGELEYVFDSLFMFWVHLTLTLLYGRETLFVIKRTVEEVNGLKSCMAFIGMLKGLVPRMIPTTSSDS